MGESFGVGEEVFQQGFVVKSTYKLSIYPLSSCRIRRLNCIIIEAMPVSIRMIVLPPVP